MISHHAEAAAEASPGEAESSPPSDVPGASCPRFVAHGDCVFVNNPGKTPASET